MALGGIARVSQAQLLQPFVTIVASVFLLGEYLDTKTILVAILVCAFVFIGKQMPVYKKA
jgi:drug/metabolite transporter (DMT)-like permease